jgi:hypothetical protein
MPLRHRLNGTDPRSSSAPKPTARAARVSGDRRLRSIVGTLVALPSYSEELGLNLDDPSDWFPWFLSASLFAKPIAATTALRTASLLIQSGVRTPQEVKRTGWDALVRLLDKGGYVRYDFSTADKLLEIARDLGESELLLTLSKERSFPKVEKRLTTIRGVGPKTVEIFLRELQGRWKSAPSWSEEARQAAHRLGLDLRGWALAPSRRRRIENGLVRLWIEHCKPGRWQNCPVAVDCECQPADRRDHRPRKGKLSS